LDRKAAGLAPPVFVLARRPAAEAAVDFKKLGNLLAAAGAVVLLGACFWWFAFYTSVVRDIGRLTGGGADAGLSDVLTCLYSSGGVCSLIAGASSLTGKTPYEPMVFWFGLAGLLLGLLIRYTAKPSGAA
jgi:hypothetical protein